MQITVISAEKAQGTSKAGKAYSFIEVAYKGEDGKVTGRKVMSFGESKKVFDALSTAGNGDVFEINSVKNESTGYWDWIGATKSTGGAVATKPNPNPAPAGKVVGSNYETPEERAKKQVYIVRQSSIANAVAFLKGEDSPVERVIEVAKEFEKYVFDLGQPEAAATPFVDDVL